MRLQTLFLYSFLALFFLTGSQQNMRAENNAENEGMSDGAMAGLIAGSVAGLAVGATAIGVGIKKYQDGKKENDQSEKKGQAVDVESEKLQKNLDQMPDQGASRVSTTSLTPSPSKTPSLDDEGKEIKPLSPEEERKQKIEDIRAKNLTRGQAPLPPVRSEVVPAVDRNAVLKAELKALEAQDLEGQQRALEEQRAQGKQRSEALKQDLQQGETEQKKLTVEMEEKSIAADKEDAQLKAQEEALKQKSEERVRANQDAEKQRMVDNAFKEIEELKRQQVAEKEDAVLKFQGEEQKPLDVEQKSLTADAEVRAVQGQGDTPPLPKRDHGSFEERKKEAEGRGARIAVLDKTPEAEKEATILKSQDVKAEQSIKDVDARNSESFKSGIMSQSEAVVAKEAVDLKSQDVKAEQSMKDIDPRNSESFKSSIMSESKADVAKEAIKAPKSEGDGKSLFIEEKKYIKSADHMRGQVSDVALRNIEKHQKVVARYIKHNAHIVKLEEQIKLLKEDIKKSSGADMLHKKDVLRLAKANLAENKKALAEREANIEKGRAMIEKQIGPEKYKELFPKDVIKKVRKQEFRKAENKIQRQESKIAALKNQIEEHKRSVRDTKKQLETKLRYDPAKGAKGNTEHNQMMSDMENEKSKLEQKKQKLQEKEQKLQKNKAHLQQQRAKVMLRHF
jgi:hypothetical protein